MPERPCKPSFVAGPFGPGGEHSSRALIAQGLVSEQPGSSRRATFVPCGTLPYWLLLQVGFAVPLESPRARCALTAPFHPYRFPGGLFSVALSCGSPRLAVSQHPALWSSDFPLATSF